MHRPLFDLSLSLDVLLLVQISIADSFHLRCGRFCTVFASSPKFLIGRLEMLVSLL